jgi:glucosamine--fructose-6-phosphate aminotransferase (isomerizing)
MDSTIAREADNVIYTRAGIEVSVASTKAFLSQLVVLYLIAQKISGKKLVGLQKIPELIRQVLKNDNKIRDIAKKYYKVYNFFYIGRNLNYPIALEGALKLKEISYIHAEGYASGELKHGPISLVTDEIPTIAIAPQDAVYEKMLSNIGEIKARKGKVIAIATHGDKKIKEFCEDVIYIPRTNELLTPLLTVIPLQLFAYHVADCRKCDIDKPRNLAKSVTVE